MTTLSIRDCLLDEGYVYINSYDDKDLYKSDVQSILLQGEKIYGSFTENKPLKKNALYQGVQLNLFYRKKIPLKILDGEKSIVDFTTQIYLTNCYRRNKEELDNIIASNINIFKKNYETLTVNKMISDNTFYMIRGKNK